ncbi:MAG: FAD-linked oxidase C-terminal domain-containing protein [Phycisphaerae bacterium]
MTLPAELERLLPPDRLLRDAGELAVYANDAFTLVEARPEAVVLPQSTAEVATVVRWAAVAGVALVPRGAGTSLAGGTIAIGGGVCLCLSRMRRILEIDYRDRFARVEAGVTNLAISQAVAAAGWHYAPDPSSQVTCTIGGNVNTNAGGPHTLKYGVTANHVLGATVVWPDGTVESLGGPYDDAPGADLLGLLIGSEGTLGIVTEATVRLTRSAPAVRTLLAEFDRLDSAAVAIARIAAAGIVPAALEMMDRTVVCAVEDWLGIGLPRDAEAVLIIELDGLEAGLDAQAARVAELARGAGCRAVRAAATAEQRADWWKARKKSFGALGRVGHAIVTQDGVVPPSQVPEIARRIAAIAERRGVRVSLVMHAGDGNIHPLLLYDGRDERQVRAVVAAGYDILDACVALGGTVSGEHGVGVEKVEHLRRMLDPASIAAQERVRSAIDPRRGLNPDKLFAGGGGCVERLRPPRGIQP